MYSKDLYPPYTLSPAFEPGITEYEVTVPFDTTEVHFRGTPRLRASVRYAAGDGSEELQSGVFSYTGIEDKVFIVTAWEEYMDDTNYEIRVKRESPQVYLADLSVRHGMSLRRAELCGILSFAFVRTEARSIGSLLYRLV